MDFDFLCKVLKVKGNMRNSTFLKGVGLSQQNKKVKISKKYKSTDMHIDKLTILTHISGPRWCWRHEGQDREQWRIWFGCCGDIVAKINVIVGYLCKTSFDGVKYIFQMGKLALLLKT